MPLNTTVENWAGLTCRVVDSLGDNVQPEKLVILCHGFGAPGDDLAGIGLHLLESSPAVAGSCRFVFPEAPIDLGPLGIPGGRAWWQINMARLAEINETKDYGQLTALEPPGMSEASSQLAEAVRAMQDSVGLSDASTVLGGFSQGAMISTNLVLQHGISPGMLVVFSGTLLWSEEWSASAEKHVGCPVLQSHGRQDPVLPFEPAESLRDMLSENGFPVTFMPFNGGHTIHPGPLSELVRLLEESA